MSETVTLQDKEYKTYTVQAGNTLSQIAHDHGLSDYKEIRRLTKDNDNKVMVAAVIANKNMIYPGETLLLPVQEGTVPNDPPPYYVPLNPEYNRLYKAVEDATPNMVGPAVTALLNYCEETIDSAIAWLTSYDSQVEPTVQSKFKVAASTWKGCLADNDAAVDALMDPITSRFPNVGGNDYARGKGLAKADLLHGRLVQLSRLIAMQESFTA